MMQTANPPWPRWLLIGLLLTLCLLLFARKITQLALPGLDVRPKTVVIEPQCPTPEQKAVIERNLKLYGAGFSQGYDNQIYAERILALARSLGYPNPTMDEINSVLRFLRKALKLHC